MSLDSPSIRSEADAERVIADLERDLAKAKADLRDYRLTQKRCDERIAEYRDEVRRLAIEKGALTIGMNTALGEIDRAEAILAEEWEGLSREDFEHLVSRSFTVLVNAREFTRALFVASIPRDDETAALFDAASEAQRAALSGSSRHPGGDER